jgi:hypothetical protein
MAGPGLSSRRPEVCLKIIRLTVLIIAPAFSRFKGLFAGTKPVDWLMWMKLMERSGVTEANRGWFARFSDR